MAKKKENQLTYLQMPLPESRKYSKMTKRSWNGLNYRYTIDSGALSMENNISTLEAPYLTPSQVRETFFSGYYSVARDLHPISMFGFDNFLIVIYKARGVEHTEGTKVYIKDEIRIDYIVYDEGEEDYVRYTGLVGVDETTKSMDDDEYAEYVEQPRCVVQFNAYLESEDIINGEYKKKLLIFPDKVSMDFDFEDLITGDKFDGAGNVSDKGTFDFKVSTMDSTVIDYENKEAPYLPPDDANTKYYYRNTHDCEETLHGKIIFGYVETENEDGETEGKWVQKIPPNFPNIKYATVHLSRLFGVSEDSVYASGFNDYTNWQLDSEGSYNEGNAWCSKAQSNTKADGDFTGITNFQGHVVCFKRDYMHEIYSTKNPFRIQDIYAEGAIDNRTIQDVDGKLIFVSEDYVKVYTGANPRILSYELGIEKFDNAVSGTDGRCYYLYCGMSDESGRLFVYDTLTESWSEQSIKKKVISFAHNKIGMYALCSNGTLYKMDTGYYSHDWSFETDLITNQTVDIKHLKKIQMLVDIPEYVNGIENEGAEINVYVLYNDEKFNKSTSHLVYSGTGYGRKPIRVRPRNRKNASYGIKLHVEGHGYVKLYEMELCIEAGGDSYVSK